MSLLLWISSYSFLGFAIGYVLGRIGHYWVNDWMGNPDWTPHHWIYGALIIPASTYFTSVFGLVLLFFGVGHFISDLKDFLELKFFAPDAEGPKRFFHID